MMEGKKKKENNGAVVDRDRGKKLSKRGDEDREGR